MGRARIILKPTPMIRKQAGLMRKLLGIWDKSTNESAFDTKLYPQLRVREGRPDFLDRQGGLDTTFVTRRQIVLNRHFTEIISDVLANNLKKLLLDMGISVTSIETKAWNQGVNIFYSSSKRFDESTHQELNSLVSQLRAAIAERRLIGKTPVINFVYDQAAEIDKDLEETLKSVKISSEPSKSLEKLSTAEIKSSRKSSEKDTSFLVNKFSCPDDMSNTVLGMNYPSLYNEIISKIERGRGQSERIKPNVSLMSNMPPMRRVKEDVEEDDPTIRIHKMQKFLVSQRKKSEYLSKLRRKEEILARDSVKWDLPPEEDEPEPCEPFESDVH